MFLPSDTCDINIYVCYKAAASFRAFALLEARQEGKVFKENQSSVLWAQLAYVCSHMTRQTYIS